MTLIAAYIHKGKAHIIADSAETMSFSTPFKIKNSPRDKDFSSLFELPYFNEKEQKIVMEATNKIYCLNNELILTFSGSVSEGEDITKQIKYSLERDNIESIPSLILSILKKLQPTKSQYIVGGMENDYPFLVYYFDDNNHKILTKLDHLPLCIAGYGTQIGFSHLIEQTIKDIIKNHELTCEESLVMVCSICQFFSLKELTLKDGVGGFLNGVLISKDGIEWVSDTTFVQYSAKNPKGDKYVSHKYNRDNSVFIIAPHFKSCFTNSLETYKMNDLVKKWQDDIVNKSNNIPSIYFVMISYDTATMVIISNKRNKKNRITLKNLNGDKIFNFTSETIKHMTSSYHSDNIEEIAPYFYTNFLSWIN